MHESDNGFNPDMTFASVPTESELITDPTEAYLMAYAVKPYADELSTNRESLTTEEAFQLGIKAGAAMIGAQLQYGSDVDREPSAEPDSAPLVLADESALRDFALQRDYNPAFVGRALNGLLGGSLRHPDSPLGVLTKQLRQTAQENDSRLDVSTLRDILRLIVVDNNGYVSEVNLPTIRNFGIGSISFLADYVNHALKLEGEDRIPLGRT